MIWNKISDTKVNLWDILTYKQAKIKFKIKNPLKNLLSIINALDTSHPNYRTVLLNQNVSKFNDFNRKTT